MTGASQGIGEAVSRKLMASGYDVIGIARKRPTWWPNEFIMCDLGSRTSLEAACHQLQAVGPIWALINNAATHIADPIESISIDDMMHVMMVNVIAPALLMRTIADEMTDGGRVVNLCSTAMHGKRARTSYGASKAALASMTRTWARELGPRGITVNGVSLGPIDTPLFRRDKPHGGGAEQAILNTIPVGFIGRPDQVAQTVAFLLGDEQGYLTGEILTLDGGSSAGRDFG